MSLHVTTSAILADGEYEMFAENVRFVLSPVSSSLCVLGMMIRLVVYLTALCGLQRGVTAEESELEGWRNIPNIST